MTNFLDKNFLDDNLDTTLDDICGNKRLEKITTPTEDGKTYQRLNTVYTITLPLE